MPRHDADLYDYLATSKVSEVTVAQLEQSLENSFFNKSNIEFWKGPITVHRLLEVSRTYPWGLPIPEAGKIASFQVIADGIVTIQPEGTEIWDVKAIRGIGIGGAAEASTSFNDGVLQLDLRTGSIIPTAGVIFDLNEAISSPIRLTNSLWMTITETGSVNGMMILVAYDVVGL